MSGIRRRFIVFKRLFQSDSSQTEPLPDEARGKGVSPSVTPASPVEPRGRISTAAPDSFEHVYENAAVQPPALSFGILKVADMVGSPHLATMSPDLKRNSILMALDAAGAQIDYLLEDAVFRQRALNDHEEALQKKLKDFEAASSTEVDRIQAQLKVLTDDHMSRIQNNLDDLAREQDYLRGWQKRKQQESQRIAEAATYCVPKSSPELNDGFAALLERGAAAGRR
jgi:hypothetical protein